MARTLRFLFVTGAVAVAALGGAAHAFACGSDGYTYAGLVAPKQAFGISASITSVDDFAVLHGHVAGWVGVGGPGEGPGSADEWLQIGLSGFPGVTGSDLYYEVVRPGLQPVYHQVASSLPVGTSVNVAVLEMHDHPDWWRVSLNGRAVSRPIRLPGSRDRWTPMATAESWDGGTGASCNSLLYRFRHIQLAHAPGGAWHSLSSGYPIKSPTTRIRRARGGAGFLAAEGRRAFRLLASLSP